MFSFASAPCERSPRLHHEAFSSWLISIARKMYIALASRRSGSLSNLLGHVSIPYEILSLCQWLCKLLKLSLLLYVLDHISINCSKKDMSQVRQICFLAQSKFGKNFFFLIHPSQKYWMPWLHHLWLCGTFNFFWISLRCHWLMIYRLNFWIHTLQFSATFLSRFRVVGGLICSMFRNVALSLYNRLTSDTM